MENGEERVLPRAHISGPQHENTVMFKAYGLPGYLFDV